MVGTRTETPKTLTHLTSVFSLHFAHRFHGWNQEGAGLLDNLSKVNFERLSFDPFGGDFFGGGVLVYKDYKV